MLLILHVAQAGESSRIYVSPQGNDGGPGTQERPFETLERARQAVRTLMTEQTATGGITVELAAGTYFQQKTVILGPEDSGSSTRNGVIMGSVREFRN